ncbi:MAG: TrmH family RNA methyltransferase [Candidatus Nomurabacteria bacterium]|jgi:tRNA G18 (ribose-2'-O)-methylase SpoU|nr:TrmH family RNA methyltransferase [Candidatus Nomurabacteria bacterium]
MADLAIILHNIRSTYNVGAILRTAEGLGVKTVVFSGYTPFPAVKNDPRLPHLKAKIDKQINKVALGAEKMLDSVLVADFLAWARQNHYQLVALEQAPNSIKLPDLTASDLPPKIALLLGEETHGISPKILEQCAKIIEIPMCGQKESFNVSVAAGIALYQLTLLPHNPCQKSA